MSVSIIHQAVKLTNFCITSPSDGLRKVYSAEGIRGLYKGSLLALVGVTNGSIQFAAYEEIKRRRSDIKRARLERNGEEWGPQHDMLVSRSPSSESSPFRD
jgi:hypothetical protein